MKSFIVALLFTAGCILSTNAHAQPYKMALGVRLSSAPAVVGNSISFKYFLNEKAAIEALITPQDPVALGALFALHKPINTPGLSWFYGAGAYFGFGDTYNLGAQGVVGLDYKFESLPINLALDWKPELNIIKDINFEPAAIGLTARFVFGQKKTVAESTSGF